MVHISEGADGFLRGDFLGKEESVHDNEMVWDFCGGSGGAAEE